MHFERLNVFQNAEIFIYFFSRFLKKMCAYPIPKIFRPVTQNTPIFFIWPYLNPCPTVLEEKSEYEQEMPQSQTTHQHRAP